MTHIDNIHTFKEIYSKIHNYLFFTYYTISDEILEYYVSNYIYINWLSISLNHMLSERLINKYADRIDWLLLFMNKNTILTYDIVYKNIYNFNLYEAYINYNSIFNISGENIEIINKLITEFKDKFEMDKLTYVLNK